MDRIIIEYDMPVKENGFGVATVIGRKNGKRFGVNILKRNHKASNVNNVLTEEEVQSVAKEYIEKVLSNGNK